MARIPPIQCLQAFEAVARRRSVNQASEELNVTPSAVSHRIRQLETHLGRKLFTRDFALSDEGANYLEHVRQGLRALAQWPGQQASPTAARLRLAVTPTFSRQILLPRLALFRHAYPEVELVLQVLIPLLDTKGEATDIEIRYGSGAYPGMEQVRVMSDELSPVCSPDYLHQFGPLGDFSEPLTLTRARLIHTPLAPWGLWFQAHGMSLPDPRDGAQFNDVGLVLDAAAAGFGIALMHQKLGATWLANGRLLRLSPRNIPSPYQHYLCWKPGALERWECSAFVDWLTRQAL